MDKNEFTILVREAVATEYHTLPAHVTRADVEQHSEWHQIARCGYVEVDGVRRKIGEDTDDTSDGRTFTVYLTNAEMQAARKARGARVRPTLPEMDLLTTPEEDFGTGRRGGHGEPA